MAQPYLTIKRGDTFFFYLDIKLADGVTPLVVTVDKLKCQVREVNGNLVDEMTISTTETEGRYLFSSPAENTVSYPVANLETDVKITDGLTTSTSTLKVVVEKDVTQWATI